MQHTSYSDYSNPEWIRKFEELNHHKYRVNIYGSMLCITEKEFQPVPLYKKILGRIYLKEKYIYERYIEVCKINIRNMHNGSIVEILKSYGFDINF